MRAWTEDFAHATDERVTVLVGDMEFEVEGRGHSPVSGTDVEYRPAYRRGRACAASAWKEALAEKHFVRPEILWWAFDWVAARKQAKAWCRTEGCREKGGEICCPSCGEPTHPPASDGPGQWRPGQGCVVLVDEIDKADTDMSNGLLESFGNNGFQVPHARTAVRRQSEHVAPLLVITTNEERELPVAFLRRCAVLHMKLPPGDQLVPFLMQRGRDQCAA